MTSAASIFRSSAAASLILSDAVKASIGSLVARGGCLELVLACFSMTRPGFESFARNHGIRSPSVQAFQATRHPKAWSLEDYRRLSELWLANRSALDIAKEVGRSKGSIYAKRRYLCLPDRDRRLLAAAARASSLPPTHLADIADGILTASQIRSLSQEDRRGKRWRVDGSELVISMKPNRDELVWTPAMYDEVAQRHLALQHPRGNAHDWGVTLRTIKSAIFWQELPDRDRSKLVVEFDPSAVAANLKASGYVKRKCANLENWSFWSPERGGSRLSRRYKSSRAYSDALALA